jgi:hypothetical protein
MLIMNVVRHQDVDAAHRSHKILYIGQRTQDRCREMACRNANTNSRRSNNRGTKGDDLNEAQLHSQAYQVQISQVRADVSIIFLLTHWFSSSFLLVEDRETARA